MKSITLYHNPRCSKSRETLQLLHDHGIEPEVVEYLKTPPDEQTLRSLIKMLGVEPLALMRTKEPVFKELGLDQKKDDADALIKAMLEHPILIERPIVVAGNKARLGRPPEKVLEIL